MNSNNFINYNNYLYELIFFNTIINKKFFINGISSFINKTPDNNTRKEIFKVIQGNRETENFSVSSSESSCLFKNTELDSVSDKKKNKKGVFQ